MAYINRIPSLSRTNQSTRDKDFIPITELKDFDALLDEIVKKFSAANDTDTIAANNIGIRIKNIEYNMADALIFDEKGNIIGYKEKTDEYTNAHVADQGPQSMDNLVSELEITFNEFVKLMGGDETKDNWKYELELYFDNAINTFKEKIDSIFKRSINAATIEAKENSNYNYTHKTSVKLDNKSVMRLNPDNLSYTRTISVLPRNLEEEQVIFEVQELEAKNLVLNMKVSNGSMYYNFNIIIDNDEFHVSKEEHIKLNDYIVTIKIYKYLTLNGDSRYVFTFSSTDTKLSECEFELSGILVSTFDFNNTGFPLDSHNKYYSYNEVDTSSDPDYNTVYYTIDNDDYKEVVRTVEEIPGIPKVVSETDKVIITEKVDTKHITERVTEQKESQNHVPKDVYIEHFHLKKFEEGVKYYTKDSNFTFYNEIVINEEKTDGTVDNSNIDQNGVPYIIDNQQTLVNTKKYTSKVGLKTVDVDCGELFGPSHSIETINKSVELTRPDTGIHFKSPIDGTIIETREEPFYNNGNLMVGYGSKAIELISVKPNEAVCVEPIITEKRSEELKQVVVDYEPPVDVCIKLPTDLLDDNLYLTEYTRNYNNTTFKIKSGLITSYSIYNKNSLLDDLIKIDGVTNTSILKILQQQLRFVDCFEIDPNLQIINNTVVDIKIYCDKVYDYLHCVHIYFNTSKYETINVPKIHKVLTDITNSIDLNSLPAKPKCLCSDHFITLAILDWTDVENPPYDVYISYNGIKFFKSPEMSKFKFTNVLWDGTKTFVAWSDVTKKIYISSIGYGNWSEVNITLAEDEVINNIISTGLNRYFVVTNHSVYFSESLYSFEKMNGLIDSNYYDVACNGKRYVLTGDGDNRYYMDDSNKTEDMLTWTKASEPLGIGKAAYVKLATYNEKGFVAVGQSGIIYSELGDSWISKEDLDASLNTGYDSVISCYAVENDSPLIYGHTIAYAKGTNRFKISSDYGVTWDKDTLPLSNDEVSEPTESKPVINNIYWTGKLEELKCIINTDRDIYKLRKTKTIVGDGGKEVVTFTYIKSTITLDNEPVTSTNLSTLCFANVTDDANECYILGGIINDKFRLIYSKDCSEWFNTKEDAPIQITALNDIKMDNKNYIIGTANNSIYYDSIDGVFVTNGLDKGRNLKYKSFDYKGRSITFGFGGGTNKTFLVNKTNGDVVSNIELELDNICEISGAKNIITPIKDSYYKSNAIKNDSNPNKNITSFIFGIPGDSTKGLILFNFDDSVLDGDKFTNYGVTYKKWSPTTTSSSLDEYTCEDLLETSKGLFIKCRKNKEAHILYCAYKAEPDFVNCVLYEDPVSILQTEYIDNIYLNGDELIVSTFDSTNPARKWLFDSNTCTFKSLDIRDLNHIYSFNKVIKYNNELFIYNGSGIMGEITTSETGEVTKNTFERGVVRLTKVLTQIESEDNGFYDVELLIPDETAQYGKETPLFVAGNTLYAYVNKKLHKYDLESSKFIPATDDVLTESLINNIFVNEDNSFKNELNLVIQTSMNGNSKINTYNIGVDDPDYTIDKFYFNDEIDLISNKYKLLGSNIVLSKQLNKNIIDLVIGLAKDCKLAIFDKANSELKICDPLYSPTGSTDSGYIKFNKTYQTITYVTVGTNDTDSILFFLVEGKFPSISYDRDGNMLESYDTSIDSKHLFSINLNELRNATSDTRLYVKEELGVGAIESTNNIDEFLKSSNYIQYKSTSTKIVDGKLFIGSCNDIMYPNAESIILWNDASSCIDIITKNNWDTNIDNVDILKEYYDEIPLVVDEANKRCYRIVKSSGKTFDIEEYPGITSNFVRVGKESYLCGTQFNTASNPSKPNINMDLGIDNLQQTEFGALAWGSKNTSGDVTYNPNECNNLHYIIGNDGSISIDQFTSNGDRYYNKAKQTRLGLFRWYDFSDSKLNTGLTRPEEYLTGSEDYNTGFCYFTPRNSGIMVKITPGPNKYIYRIFDTYEGTFIAAKDYRWYGVDSIVDTVEFWTLYRVVGIPTDSDQRISIYDTRYFERVDCYDGKISSLFDTQYGLFAVSRIEADERNSVDAYSSVLRWNGEDFSRVMDNTYPITDMIDSSEGLFFFTAETSPAKTYVWDNKLMEVVPCGGSAPFKYDPQISGIDHGDYFGSQKNNLDTDFGSVIFGRGKLVKLTEYYNTKSVSYQGTLGYGPCTLQKLRVYNTNRIEGNLKPLAKYLANELHLPLDVNIKLVGSIMYNGFQVPVSGLKIYSKNGVSDEPYSVKFTIDKDARFTLNEKTIENIIDTKSNGPDIGTITDYDPDNKVYNTKPIIISKMNFTAIYND